LLLLLLIGQAFGGERMSCKVQPVRGDGREWHYRTASLRASGRG
jgi:hypothetical protein